MSKVWLITGAGRGMGAYIAKAALAAGHKVVATGRKTDKVAHALGKSADLFVVKLDITKPTDAESAVKASVDKFGRIDVLVNNAANFYAGFFEELLPEQMERQLSTSLVGPMNVTRAVLPVMRKQRSGLIITISSTAGLIGFEFGTAYAASKFGLEGWMQSLQAEIEPFGIDTITVNPGFFRTELLTEESTNFAERTIEDYNDAQSEADGILERRQRSAVRRPRQARTGIDYDGCPARRRAAAADIGAGHGLVGKVARLADRGAEQRSLAIAAEACSCSRISRKSSSLIQFFPKSRSTPSRGASSPPTCEVPCRKLRSFDIHDVRGGSEPPEYCKGQLIAAAR